MNRILLQLARAAVRRAGTPPIGGSESIASLERIDLNGYPQWVLLRGQRPSNPLLLYVHGGPGSAEMALAHRSMPLLEKHFVCVNWDQRGAGKSFDPGPAPGTMNIRQFVDDAIALIEVLRVRFGQDKVLLVGHSWGTVLTMKVAEARPDLVHAVIALGQVVDMQRGEEISYRFVLDRAVAAGNARAVRASQDRCASVCRRRSAGSKALALRVPRRPSHDEHARLLLDPARRAGVHARRRRAVRARRET